MAQGKTNHLKIQFHVWTKHILQSQCDCESVMLAHTGCCGVSNATAGPAFPALAVARPQSAHLSRAEPGLVPPPGMVISFTSDFGQNSCIYNSQLVQKYCRRQQILTMLGAVQTQGDGSSPTAFPTHPACSTFSNTFLSLLRQEILSTCFAFFFCTCFPSKLHNSNNPPSGVGLDLYLSEPLSPKVSKCLLEGSSPSRLCIRLPTPGEQRLKILLAERQHGHQKSSLLVFAVPFPEPGTNTYFKRIAEGQS